MNWYLDVLKKYAVFEGRATRTEYWMFILINLIISFAIGIVEGVLGSPSIVGTLYSLAILIPSLAVSVRRLHDTGRSGWWLFLGLIPFFGVIILLIFMTLDSQPASNAFGSRPGRRSKEYINV